MSHYYHQPNQQARRRIGWVKRLLAGLLLTIALGGVMLGVDYARVVLHERDQKTTTSQTLSYYSAPLKIFHAPYFQFQTDPSWVEVTTDPKANPHVYRRLRDHFVEHELSIYVNADTSSLTANHVLPVNVTATGELLPLSVSEHCVEAFKPQMTGPIKVISLQGVSFLCDPNDSSYKVIAGLQGGTSVLRLPRPDKTTATYTLLYKNITAQPEGSQLEQLIESFQPR